jgi:hypothetical protein
LDWYDPSVEAYVRTFGGADFDCGEHFMPEIEFNNSFESDPPKIMEESEGHRERPRVDNADGVLSVKITKRYVHGGLLFVGESG